jgi:hypothetical protein
MFCTIRGKHSHFCMGWAQSIQRAVTQRMAAVGRCHMCPMLTDTSLVNPPAEPDGYPVGSVTKKWLFCQWNQPFEEDVSYCLSWLSVIVRTLVQSKTPFSDTPVSCRTVCWPPNCCLLVTVLKQGNVTLHFELFFTAFLIVVVGKGGCDRDESCFSRRKCNCGRLCTMLMSSGNWGHLSWTCGLSLRRDIACHH